MGLLEHKPAKKVKLKPPSKYKVFMLNDDYTPMTFVVDVLKDVFSKPVIEAEKIMMDIHKKGKGLCGVYPFDIAETKVIQVMALAHKNEHPLQCVMERE